jgi:hypothetical protein
MRIGFLIYVAGLAMNNLAQTYTSLGRHADALALQEKVLKLFRRVLPEGNRNIGEDDVGRDAVRAACVDCEDDSF